MKRKHFLLLSAVVAWLFGILMMLIPASFSAGIMVQPPTDAVDAWVQLLGTNIFAIGCINFLSRNSPWSPAIRGILIGNVVLHVLAIVFDVNTYRLGIVNLQGVLQGAVVHTAFIAGFSYYAFRSSAREGKLTLSTM
jgi:hypothetical protein